MALIPEFYMDAVVALGVEQQAGQKKWCATGFLVGKKVDENAYQIFLVTNKHVFQGEKHMLVRLNLPHTTTAKDFSIALIKDNGEKVYSEHPNNVVDVACVYINGAFVQKELGGSICYFELDSHTLTRKEMLENEIVEGSLVYTLGFPAGLVGVTTKAPLCRLGCISRIKESVNVEGFMLDTQNFPGSSGSPVINRLETSFLEGSKHFNKTCLIGILASYIPYADKLTSFQTGKVMQITQENSGLAIAYSVDAIKEVIELETKRIEAIFTEQKDGNNESDDQSED